MTEAKLINTDRILNHHFLLRLSGIVLERRFPVLRRIDHQQLTLSLADIFLKHLRLLFLNLRPLLDFKGSLMLPISFFLRLLVKLLTVDLA